MPPLQLGIFIFPEVEVLDFAGPYEVFSLAENEVGEKLFQVHTIGETTEMIKARNGLQIATDYTFNDHPELDVLIIPGGHGARVLEVKKQKTLDWIQSQSQKVDILASVCTGAFLLAKLGLLDQKNATTHWAHYSELEDQYPSIEVQRNVKFVDEGKIITAGGISAGINMSFYLVSRLFDKRAAQQTAKRMEYDIQLTMNSEQ
ncbi:MAG: DJ-1/PfpI family protein [Bacteroidota bacterium]